MLYIEPFTFNAFQENTYLIYNEKKECWIIDPGMYDNNETNHLKSFIEEKQLQPQAVINTHTHIDHIFGVDALKSQYGIEFLIHEKDLPVLNGAVGSAMLFGFDFKQAPKPEKFIYETQPLVLGDDEIKVLFTPGHSPGSVSFYYSPGKWVIGGDVLFSGSIGRTDLPGGNFETLIYSIRTQLFTLPDETTVYSGHGPATTIGREKQSNPFLQ
ncbi:MAG: fold metallo-hydrolase [Flavipsychrobacter sp.]|jgi:glyoxylase-like metal-dependent hydrolase (beta-lactamase superfamily II)|nr:fold metallo-hydrolase [Flavipsychrobacter sp.]